MSAQGDPGSLFYIIKEGEAVVLQSTPQGQKKVNHLFKADFFGERALLSDEPRHVFQTILLELLLPCWSQPGAPLKVHHERLRQPDRGG